MRKAIEVANSNLIPILYSILISFPIEYGIDRMLKSNFDINITFNFITFLITAIRFFHGNNVHSITSKGQRPREFFVNTFFIISELIILCMAGQLVDNTFTITSEMAVFLINSLNFIYIMFLNWLNNFNFIYALLVLSLIDISWALYSIITAKPGERHNFRVWGLLNVVSATFLIFLIIFSYNAIGIGTLFILIFYIVITVLDYYFSRDFYFKLIDNEDKINS